MRPDEISDVSSSKTPSIFGAYLLKNQKRFATFLKLSASAIFFWLGAVFIIPFYKLESTSYLPIFAFVCGVLMLITTFFRFLITHHERNIAAEENQSLAPTQDSTQIYLHLFLSIFISALVISRVRIFFNGCIDYYSWHRNQWALSSFAVVWLVIALFFIGLALKGAYRWALYLDQKIRKAKNYSERIDVIFLRFLGFLGVVVLGILLAEVVYQLVLDITGSDFRSIWMFILVGVFINFLIYGAFSLFLLIHTVRSYKNQHIETT
jgi:hypothetical protein